MNYALSIRDANVQAHLDIEKEVKDKKNGLFTFTLRVNNGNIADVNFTEYVNVREKYGIIKAIIVREVTVKLPSSLGSGE